MIRYQKKTGGVYLVPNTLVCARYSRYQVGQKVLEQCRGQLCAPLHLMLRWLLQIISLLTLWLYNCHHYLCWLAGYEYINLHPLIKI